MENNKIQELALTDITSKRELFSSVLNDFQNDLNEINIDSISSKDGFKELFGLISDLKMNLKSLTKSINEPFKAAVMGAQGVGKSTIINLLVEEDLMPHSYMENEGGIIKTVYTDDIKLDKTAKIYYFPDDKGLQKTENISYSEFLNLVDLNKSKALLNDPKYKDKVEYFELYSKNNNLKDVQIINTPGVNVLTSDFYEKIRHLFMEADIIIWVFSKNNILDKFNKEKIRDIYKDNSNIIGILSKADKLFGEDVETGVKDVVDQFLDEIEDGILYRVNRNGKNLISLFPYNGKAALIASDLEPNILISDNDNIEAQEEKELMMLWNYINYGYPYISNGVDIRYDLNLYTPVYSEQQNVKLNNKPEFKLKGFISELIDNNILSKIKDEEANYKLIFTDKGKELLMKCSQLSGISDFANNYIFSKKLNDKLFNVKDRFNLFYTDNNKISSIENIKMKYGEKLRELNSDFDNEKTNLENRISKLSLNYKEWSENRLYKITKTKGTILIDEIIHRIDTEISRSDMAKEIWNLVKSKFGGDKEGPAMKQIQKICEESILKIIDESLDEITGSSLEEIDNILKELEYDGESINSIKVEANSPKVNLKLKSPKPNININFGKIIEKLKPLLKTAVVKLAQKDLRKRMPQILKKFVMMLRVVLKKIGINFAKKQAAKTGAKAGMGPGGWILLIYDVFDIANSIYQMLGDMKKQIKEDLEENNSDFTNSIRDIFSKIYSDILDETVIMVRGELNIDDRKVEELQLAINVSNQIISVFSRYQNSLN